MYKYEVKDDLNSIEINPSLKMTGVNPLILFSIWSLHYQLTILLIINIIIIKLSFRKKSHY